LRNIVYRFEDSSSFARALHGGDQELQLPAGEGVADGEWVLAIFEVGKKRRATAAAARGLQRGTASRPVLTFERRDWERLVDFAEAGSSQTKAATPQVLPSEPPTEPSLFGGVADVIEPPTTPSLPADPDSAPWPAIQSPVPPNLRVLLVDDDREILRVVTRVLVAAGLQVDSVSSAELALDRVRTTPCDLMVLDWNLPGMTGIELCRLVRSDPAFSTLPVIFLTGHDASRDILEAFEAGADDYVVKPFRTPELSARIFSLLRRARMSLADR
jgi:two-component system phosphate regulon response regulator PhoB